MNIELDLDLDSQELNILIDNHLPLKILKDDDGFSYVGFGKIDDSGNLGESLKEIAKILFVLEC